MDPITKIQMPEEMDLLLCLTGALNTLSQA